VKGCSRPAFVFNTERGVRWHIQIDRVTWPNWDEVPPNQDTVIPMTLEGPNCRP